MHFVLDHDVDAAVAGVLRGARHTCETASTIRMATADDDQLAVYADDHHAVFMTHDRESIHRRKRNTFGRNVWLACRDLDAVEVITVQLTDIVALVATRDAIVVRVTRTGVRAYPTHWE